MNKLAKILMASALAAAALAQPAGAAETESLLARLEGEVIAVIERAAPAVVCVTTESLDPPWLDDPDWIGPPGWMKSVLESDFFRRQRRSSGTGFIIDPAGKILTAENVIGRAKTATITLASGREIPARVRGVDPVFGIALLQVEETGLPALELGCSDSIRPGSWAIAIGQPYGLVSSASWGIVSGLGRSGLGIVPYEELIQFTAPVNPGDSGGPVLNSRGEVIGIIAASFSGYREIDFDWDFIRRVHRAFPGMESGPPGSFFRPSQAQGIGFAIPINLARKALDALERDEECRRGWLGILLEYFPGQKEVAVGGLAPGGPAERSGLKAGDIIISIDGRQVASIRDLQKTILLSRVGEEVSLEVERNGEMITIPVTIGERGAGGRKE
ncbi:MAG: trypsin-like peptidase domain-containing protein [Candidatus Erginobacter occultus]|nr:trypsin-like peptidase domain-containing protein [Candidatus Erginobacter occultus]